MEGLATAVLLNTSDEREILQATEIQQLNWWGFGLELFLLISEEDIKELLESINLTGEKKLHLIVEGRPPTCYVGGRKGHMR